MIVPLNFVKTRSLTSIKQSVQPTANSMKIRDAIGMNELKISKLNSASLKLTLKMLQNRLRETEKKEDNLRIT